MSKKHNTLVCYECMSTPFSEAKHIHHENHEKDNISYFSARWFCSDKCYKRFLTKERLKKL